MAVRRIVQQDPWRFFWCLATGNGILVVVLSSLALYLLLLCLLPQAPGDPSSLEQWLIQAQARFGQAIIPLYQAGLFSLAESPWPRLLLALAAFVLLNRAVERGQELWQCRAEAKPCDRQRSFRSSGFSLLTYAGALLLLLGLLINQLWGWQSQGLVHVGGTSVDVPGHGAVALDENGNGPRSARRAVTIYATGSGPTLALRALDEGGHPLSLQRSPQQPPADTLTIALAAGDTEPLLAIPEAWLMIRVGIVPTASFSAGAPLRLQVFRSPSGDLAEEAILDGSELVLNVEGVQLEVVRSAYQLLAAVYNPGRWWSGVGIVVGAVGLLGSLVWPRRQGRWPRLELFLRAAVALLTIVVAALALHSLLRSAALWNGAALQGGVTVAWLFLLALRQSTR